jgi:5-hydroxyisourate hydrolase
MTTISTHVLDLATGDPVAGMAVQLDRRTEDGGWVPLAAASTGEDGRVRAWPDLPELQPGQYRLTFMTGPHLDVEGSDAFFPEVAVVVRVTGAAPHHHVPLLLGPFGYTTYRGS